MVEKTIFIVKPIYVPIISGEAAPKDASTQKMKRMKSKQ